MRLTSTAWGARIRLGCHYCSFPRLGDAFGNHLIPLLKTFVDNPHLAYAVAGFYGTDADAIVRTDHRHLVSALQLRNGALRHQERALLGGGGGPNAAELSGA